MMDKRWLDVVDHFAMLILGLEECQLATAEDGMKAAAITRVVLQSPRMGEVVCL